MATPGHHPTPVELPARWSVEGRTPTDTGTVPIRVEIDGTRIVSTDPAPDTPADLTLPDHQLLLPGILDVHVHCRDDSEGTQRYKEDYASASRAALHGGVVLVGDMPNNPCPPGDADAYEQKRQVANTADTGVILYAPVLADVPPFSTEVPYKCYFGPSVGELNLDPAAADSTLALFRDQLVAFHAESPQLLDAARNAPTHEERRPAEAESVAIDEITELALAHGFRPHIAHLSSAVGLESVRRARQRGVPMTCEVAPHHLFFDVENRGSFDKGSWLQMNPPLRGPEDRAALREGLLSGDIEMIATDHAPHSLQENQEGISGVPHLDTLGPYLTLLAAEGVSWSTLVDRACTAPARFFAPYIERQFGGPLGQLVAGSLASFTVLDLDAPWEVSAGDIASKCAWSPYEGVTFPGRVAYTAVAGRLHAMR